MNELAFIIYFWHQLFDVIKTNIDFIGILTNLALAIAAIIAIQQTRTLIRRQDEHSIIENRAYLGVVDAQIKDNPFFDKITHPIRLTLEVKNCGNTPAKKLNWESTLLVDGIPKENSNFGVINGALAPQRSMIYHLTFTQAIMDILKPNTKNFLNIRGTYEDYGNSPHFLEASYQLERLPENRFYVTIHKETPD